MSKFIQARNYTIADRKPHDIWYLCIHDAEFPQKPHAAEDIAHYFANQKEGPDGSSAHRVADNKEIVRCVHWKDLAWAAPGANTHGVHWEQSGYARQSKEKWTSHYGDQQLHVLARDVALFCYTFNIPVVKLHPDQLRENTRLNKPVHRGIIGHDTVTKAFPEQGTHTDPGPHFPWQKFLRYVERYVKDHEQKAKSK